MRLAALAGIGVGAAIIYRNTEPFGVGNYLRWMARGKKQQYFGDPGVVSLGECPSYQGNVLACLRKLWQQSEMPAVKGKRVLIKPNLVDSIENYPATTAPEIIGAVAELLIELGAKEVMIGDGPCFRRDAWPVVEGSKLAPILGAKNFRFLDLNYDDPRPVPIRDGWFRNSSVLWLPRSVLEADVIVSVPKLKTHHWAGVSLSLKNLFGVVPGARYGWPKNFLHINGIAASILGLYQTLPPVVAVIDGIVGMEGDGPLFGKPVHHGLLAVGRDPVAVDIICAQLMGISIESVQHLALAGWAGIGQAHRIEIRGVDRTKLQRHYQPPPSII